MSETHIIAHAYGDNIAKGTPHGPYLRGVMMLLDDGEDTWMVIHTPTLMLAKTTISGVSSTE